MSNDVTYDEMVDIAANLASEHGGNPEYDRALAELIADSRFGGIVGVAHSDRSAQVLADIRSRQRGNPGDFLLTTQDNRRVLVACPHETGWAVRLLIRDFDEENGELEHETAVRLSNEEWARLKATVDR